MSERTDDRLPAYAIVDGAHCFDTGVDGTCVSIALPLTGAQIEFLARNPAAVRACLVKGWFTSAWLEALIDQVAVIDQGGAHGRTWH